MDQNDNQLQSIDQDLTQLQTEKTVEGKTGVKSVCESTTDLISVQDPVASGEIYEGVIWSIGSVISSGFHLITAALEHLPGH